MGVRYPKEALAEAAAASTSLVDLMRRMGAPMGSIALRYLRGRLDAYDIDTSHFSDEPLPPRPRRSYSRERLAQAAAGSHSIREVIEHLGYEPSDSPYGHVRRKLAEFGIDTSHFRRAADPVVPDRARLEAAVAASHSTAGVLRLLGLPDTGASRRLVKHGIAHHGLATDHFTGRAHCRGTRSPYRLAASEVLRALPAGARRTPTARLRRALDELGVPAVCAACGLGEVWQGRPLVLEIDHVNGDPLDNRVENIRYLCPSCHSQTASHSRGIRARPPEARQ
ncbi:HNH endonuclease [Streptomyces sp. NPDC047968]|uniref:HNH endonuclease signature motif containing protein n=1 Tax=unclassified Streptomyces TaxID=2593676 RepID=UPI00343DBB9D